MVNLENSIDYQKDSVVSKEILKTSFGSITLFAFDKGQGLSEHATLYEAFVQVLDGEAEITISGKVNLIKTGGAIHMPANQPHALKAEKRFKMILTMLK